MNRVPPIFLSLITLFWAPLPTGQPQADERSPGSSDTSRRGSQEHRHPTDKRGGLSAGIPDRTLQEQVDPAIRQFWTDRCVDQRAASQSHTRDCDNPAYSGGGYGWGDPYSYPGYRPSYPGGNTVIINRGGTVVMPPQYRGGTPPARGGLTPRPRR